MKEKYEIKAVIYFKSIRIVVDISCWFRSFKKFEFIILLCLRSWSKITNN